MAKPGFVNHVAESLNGSAEPLPGGSSACEAKLSRSVGLGASVVGYHERHDSNGILSLGWVGQALLKTRGSEDRPACELHHMFRLVLWRRRGAGLKNKWLY
jgi:hypothetical protein